MEAVRGDLALKEADVTSKAEAMTKAEVKRCKHQSLVLSVCMEHLAHLQINGGPRDFDASE